MCDHSSRPPRLYNIRHIYMYMYIDIDSTRGGGGGIDDNTNQVLKND